MAMENIICLGLMHRFSTAYAIFSSFYHLLVTLLLTLVSLISFLASPQKHASTPLPPGPTPWPFIGNLHEFFINKPRFRWIHSVMKKMDTDIACIRVGSVHIIPITSPELAQEFLKSRDEIFASRPITMASEIMSWGFKAVAFTPLGDQHKKMRKVLASDVLTTSNLQWLHNRRVEETDNLVHYIYKKTCNENGGTVDIRAISRAYVGNVIRRMTFNKRYFGKGRLDGFQGFEEEEYMEATFTLLLYLYALCISDYIPSLRMFDIDGHEKIIKAAMEIINKYHDPIIDQRIKQWRNENSYNKEPQDLLDVLISLKDANGEPLLSHEEIRAEVLELTYTSVDNSSNAVEWAIAEMMTQPDILRKAVNEIDMVVGKERLAQESDLPRLNYIKACVREAFRLHPVAPFNPPHMSTIEATITGYFIPKGSHVLLSRVELGRNSRVWEDPLKFKPERHLDASNTTVSLIEPNLRFISFSTGQRGCVGISLGSSITLMLLTRLLQAFDLSMLPGEACVDLSESPTNLFLAKPLNLIAKPRLPIQIYLEC